MYGRGGAGIHIKRYAQLLHGILDYCMVTVHYVLRSDTLLTCLDGNGHAVFIAATHQKYFLAIGAEIAGIYVGRHIHTGKMTNMHRPVGIGQCCGYESTLVILFHTI